MNNDEKIYWIISLTLRNGGNIYADILVMPNGLISSDRKTFNFKCGSFTIKEAEHYLIHKTLDSVEKHDSERLTKREQVALRILLKGVNEHGAYAIASSFQMADEFLKESSK